MFSWSTPAPLTIPALEPVAFPPAPPAGVCGKLWKVKRFIFQQYWKMSILNDIFWKFVGCVIYVIATSKIKVTIYTQNINIIRYVLYIRTWKWLLRRTIYQNSIRSLITQHARFSAQIRVEISSLFHFNEILPFIRNILKLFSNSSLRRSIENEAACHECYLYKED